MSIKALSVSVGLMILCGCKSTYVEYVTPSGSYLSIHRRECMSKTEMPAVKFNPDGSVEMMGLKEDTQSGLTATVEAACKGAVKGAVNK